MSEYRVLVNLIAKGYVELEIEADSEESAGRKAIMLAEHFTTRVKWKVTDMSADEVKRIDKPADEVAK